VPQPPYFQCPPCLPECQSKYFLQAGLSAPIRPVKYLRNNAMISLTRINRSSLILNSDLIEHIQATPDTVITMTNGHNYTVLETPETIVERIADYRRLCSGRASAQVRCSHE
jgi:flagellar protein FlbD